MDNPRQDGHVVLLAPHGEHEWGIDVDDLGDEYSGHVISDDQSQASIYLRGLPGRQEVQLHCSHASCGGALLRYVHVHCLKCCDNLNQQINMWKILTWEILLT